MRPQKSAPGVMPRTITLVRAISLIMGSIIGTGIFMAPKTIIREVGSIGWAFIIWVLCGLFALFGGLAYLEIGLMLKKSGAEYTYLRYVFGDGIGYVLSFLNMMVLRPISACIMGFTFSEYILSIFTDDNSHTMNLIFAIILIWSVSLLNMYSTTMSLKCQTLFLWCKLLLSFFIIIAGLYALIFQHKTENFQNVWQGSTITATSIAKAVYGGLWPYDAWNNLNFMIEEIQQPEKNMKNAIMISLPGVIVIYLLINISYFTFLSADEIKANSAIAAYFGGKAFYGFINQLTPILVAISALGAFNGMVLSTSRFAMVAGRDGNLPKWYSLISIKYQTPITSLFIQCLLSSLYLLPRNASFHTLLDLFAFAQLFVYALTFACVIILRKREPHADRPFKIWLPIVYGLSIFGFVNTLVPLFIEPRFEYMYVIFLVVLSIGLYKILIVQEVSWISKFNLRFEKYLCEKFNLCSQSGSGISEDKVEYSRLMDEDSDTGTSGKSGSYYDGKV